MKTDKYITFIYYAETERKEIMFEIKGKFNTAKVFADTVDDETIGQIMELCNQSWLYGSQIAIMPDCHAGKGCTIGTTMTILDKVCPNLVGVDIGCGMLTVQLPKEFKNLSLEKLDAFINTEIPSGFNINEKRQYDPKAEGLYLKDLICFAHLKNIDQLERSVGSLGGGNHFLEVDKDEEGNLYLVIHSGSRNLGKQVAEYYQELAFEECNRLKEKKNLEREKLINTLINLGRGKEIEAELKKFNENYKSELKIQKDLCYLEGQHLKDYLHDMFICQHYAQVNRRVMAQKILNYLISTEGDKNYSRISLKIANGAYSINGTGDEEYLLFETVHNYISPEDHILRKGAISAKKGELVLIPINMRDGAILGIGKGNTEFNVSGPHGAGRLMSRSAAKEQVSLEEFEASMQGIYSTSVGTSTLDESPMAYKPMDEIMKNIQESVEVVKAIKPIYNFKAH